MGVLVSSEDVSFVGELARQARMQCTRLNVATSVNTLDQVRLLSPELVVLDLNQRIDGRLLLARLKQDPRTSFVRIAVVAAREDKNVQRFCREYGVASYDLKPPMPRYLERLTGGTAAAAVG